MRKVLLLTVIGLLAVGCGPKATPEELAALAARGYYQHLIRGEYEAFMQGKDSVPDDYRELLMENLRMYKSLQDSQHGGIQEVEVARVENDSLTDYTSVFLVLSYTDSTREEIVVPMVEREGRWRMK